MALSEEELQRTLKNFQRILNKGNGSLTIHYSGGVAQKIRADIDGDAINSTTRRTVA